VIDAAKESAQMSGRKVLYVVHNHASISPGGTEIYTQRVVEAQRRLQRYRPLQLSRVPTSSFPGHPGTAITVADGAHDEYFITTGPGEIDPFFMSAARKDGHLANFHRFLVDHQPDVVHFQHTANLGFEMIRVARNALPKAAIVYTLHEFLPICLRDGQMLRTRNNEQCTSASPRRCHECFPDRTAADFFMRQRFIRAHFELVDLFLSPSHFLRQRYVDWGIPAERIRFEDNGRPVEAPLAELRTGPRNRLAFFGQINPYKGLTVALKAMRLLAAQQPAAPGLGGRAGGPHLWLHGAGLENQKPEFQREVTELLTDAPNVTFCGPYQQSQMAKLLRDTDWVIVPSIWWENAPLVIQEAFMHGRPVICSDIGGMAEKVTDGVDGLHFRAGDATHLADVIAEATSSPGLWSKLREGIRPVYDVRDAARKLCGIYDELLARKAA
jgi:glycosyltransferase involved in cell wall biosynthesis